jgi:hypothetical protein
VAVVTVRDSADTKAQALEEELRALRSSTNRVEAELSEQRRLAQRALEIEVEAKTVLEECEAAFQTQLPEWTVNDVAWWVATVGAGAFLQYEEGFRQNEIDGKELLTFEGQAALAECGVQSRPQRKALWARCEELFQAGNARPASVPPPYDAAGDAAPLGK